MNMAHDITVTVHDVAVHVLGATVFELLKFLVAAFIVGRLEGWLKKSGLSQLMSRIVQLTVKLLVLAFFTYSALQSYKGEGFDNGVLFAVNYGMSLLLAVVFAYPFAIKYLRIGVKRLDWAQNLERWKTDSAANGKADIAKPGKVQKGINFGVHFSGDGDRWANMQIHFSPAEDFHCWAGIVFDVECREVYPESTIILQLVMSDGVAYTSTKPLRLVTQRAIFLFQEMRWGDWSPQDRQGYLNVRDIECVSLGCNTTLNDVTYGVSDFALIKSEDSM